MRPEYCPHCGAEVPAKAKACPECGSDERTGWSERAHTERLGLPDDEFDYDEFVKEEFGNKAKSRMKPLGISWLWWAVAIVVLLALLGLLFR
jgi:hypothetical protein